MMTIANGEGEDFSFFKDFHLSKSSLQKIINENS